MSVDLPFPPFFSLLILLLPGVWRLGLWLAAQAAPEAARLLAPALGLAAGLLAVHLASGVFGFHAGLAVGLAAAGLPGYVLWRRAAPPARRPLPRGLVLVAALGTVAILPAVAGWDFFDKFPFGTGHFSLPAQILNGIYPPRELSFPEYPVRYHLGFDLLAAVAAALTRLRLDLVVDGLTLALWAYALVLFGVAAARLIGPAAAVPGALIGGFIGRFPLFAPGEHLTNQMLGQVHVGGEGLRHLLNPPIPAYLFQHAWTLGLPLFLAAVVLAATVETAPRRPPAAVALALALLALALANTVLFLCFAGALAGAAAWALARRRPAAATAGAVLLCAAALPLLGGMLPLVARELGAVATAEAGGLRWAEGGKAGDWGASLAWNALTFGLALPLGLVGLGLLRHLRAAFVLLFAGSFAILNGVEFVRSWDIVKFGAVAALALAFGTAAVVTRLWTRPRLPARAAAVLSLVAVTAGGAAFLLPFWLDRPDIPPDPYMPAAARLQAFAASPAERRAVGWLRRRVAAGEAVFCPERLRATCSQGGGLPEWHVFDFFPHHMGVPRAAIERRLARQQRPPDPQALREAGVGWAVIPDEPRWQALAGDWAAQGAARRAAEFGGVAVYRVLP